MKDWPLLLLYYKITNAFRYFVPSSKILIQKFTNNFSYVYRKVTHYEQYMGYDGRFKRFGNVDRL